MNDRLNDDKELHFVFWYLCYIILLLWLVIFGIICIAKIEKVSERLDRIEVEVHTDDRERTTEGD